MSWFRPAYPLLNGILRSVLSGLGVVIQCDTDGATVMAVVLADDLLTVQLPETRVVIAASRNKVCAIRAESAVPDPPLVACQCCFQGKGLGLLARTDGLHFLDLPYLGRVIGAAGC